MTIWTAIQNGTLDDVIGYIDAGFDINEKHEGLSLLEFATENNVWNVALHLLQVGAKVEDVNKKFANKMTLLHISSEGAIPQSFFGVIFGPAVKCGKCL